jgi:NAD(P)-dependent dehydrogenase (short-subunit alcohol dehydrogenase family)
VTNVVITGSNRGIGLALTTLYAQRGDTVFACCRAPGKAKDLQALAKDHAINVVALDVGDDASVAALAAARPNGRRPRTWISPRGLIRSTSTHWAPFA